MILITPEILNGFTPLERLAITTAAQTSHTKFDEISEQYWRHFRGCGNRFVEKLITRKMIGQLIYRRPKIPRRELLKLKKLYRIRRVREMIAAENRKHRGKINRWRRELKNPNIHRVTWQAATGHQSPKPSTII